MEILFSIVMPVYNEGKKIRKTIDTFIFEDFKDYELILVDDGSQDESPEICEDYSKKYNFIKVIHQDNQGGVAARKEGIVHSKGKYIVFADGDDFAEKSYMKQLHDTVKKEADIYFLNNKINIPGTLDFVVEKDFLSDEYIDKGTAIEWISAGKAGAVWDKIYLGEIFRNHDIKLPVNLVYGDDVYINLSYMCFVQTVYAYNISPYLHVRDSEGSVCNNLNVKHLEEVDILYSEGMKLLEELNANQIITNKFACVQISNYAKAIASLLNSNTDKKVIEDYLDSSKLMKGLDTIRPINSASTLYYNLLKHHKLNILRMVCGMRDRVYKFRKKPK